ncbi:unnamed protein product (macronuclear) [Paramecium tetraurelia]|uniref:protein-tyrosine-phosphatase n=1 Tax=Paramecium tetraurelia TaxID=5888 RepID=A0BZ53_PARTE|nr:uncharacterized protein GSPATT00033673001 [Paramecium tetraurelia]CAK63820.1 unnamed protein product [Paramecium tetraurelia]|eukprot:XP_001431218.1 hypothetical protein (macronuclear) [Paramecium tetraurelia strain d4-2]
MMQNNQQQQAKKVIGATLILEEKFSLYLGDLDDAQNKQWLSQQKIGCVITVANGQPVSYYDNKIKHHYYFIDDKADFKIQKYFSKVFHDIEREIQTTNVLIHCAAGISRSATFVIAYLIMKKGMSYKQAFNHVKSRRPMIRPNPGFITVLESLEQKQ